MKRILFLNYCYPGQGTYHRCWYFARHMAASGYSVDLLCSSPKAWDIGIRTKKVSDNFNVITLPSPIRPGSPVAYILRTFIGIAWVLFKKYDVIHAFGMALPSTSIPTLFARWFKKEIKIILDWDDAWGDAYGPMFGRLPHSVLAFLESGTPIWAKPDSITVVSRYFQVKLLQLGVPIGIINTIPNGADTEIIKPLPKEEARKKIGWRSGETIILSMGHNYFESLNILMELFSSVLKHKPDVKLKMLGKLLKVGRYASRIDEILEKYKKLTPGIEFLGEVPREKVGDYLCAADCLVMPMENSIMDQSRAPIRIGDYLASGRPVVSNAVGYSAEVLGSVKPNGVCTDPENVEEFAQLVLRVLNDTKLADSMGNAGLKLAEGEQNWRNICSHLESVYNTL